MKKLFQRILIFIICLAAKNLTAQNPIYTDTTITIINGDTIIGQPIEFRKYDEHFIDFMFFDGTYNVVAFRITENNQCFQFMLSSLDSSTYCFTISDDSFKQLMSLVDQMNQELEQQSNWPVKCNYCQTMQFFWYEGDHERSTLKRSYLIPETFGDILNLCYDLSTEKHRCGIKLNYFQSLEGFEDKLKGPNTTK